MRMWFWEVVLFLIFAILKFTGIVDWSWWLITAPLWIPLLALSALGWVIFLKLSRGEIV